MGDTYITDRYKSFSIHFRITDIDSETRELSFTTLQVSGKPDVRVAASPEVRKSGFSWSPEVRNSGFPKVQESGFSKIRFLRILGNPVIRDSGPFPALRVSGRPEIRTLENSEFRISGVPDLPNPGFPDDRICGKSEYPNYRYIINATGKYVQS